MGKLEIKEFMSVPNPESGVEELMLCEYDWSARLWKMLPVAE